MNNVSLLLGRIGIKFSDHGKKLFVLRLTEEGKRIFGWDFDYVSVGPNNTFTEAWTELQPEVPSDKPNLDRINYQWGLDLPAGTDEVIAVFNNSIFSHSGEYRHEIVLNSSLPLRSYLECDQKKALVIAPAAAAAAPAPVRVRPMRRRRLLTPRSTRTGALARTRMLVDFGNSRGR